MASPYRPAPIACAVAACLLVGGSLLVACSSESGDHPKGAGSASASAAASTTPSALTSAVPSASASAALPAPFVERLPDTPDAEYDQLPKTVAAQREALYATLRWAHGLNDQQIGEIRAIFEGMRWMSQGNPDANEHPMSRSECRRIRRAAASRFPAIDQQRCGRAYMSPVFDPTKGETAATAHTCVDQFEFPGAPCEYPVTWVPARDASRICRIMGKRLCDAHEWEGACAGRLRPPEEEYAFGQIRKVMQGIHNHRREKVWAYGATKDHKKCATGSHKSKGCITPSWKGCGTNTYPTGAFPECTSRFGVWDLHGNAAEHMNLPLEPKELASRGGLGETEMKGSWFIFDSYEAHEDDCHWRAPAWHQTRVDSPMSHYNYHLGFRCCSDIDSAKPAPR